MSFFAELKRRNVIRVAATYIVLAWLLIQVAETIFPLFGFDDTPARIVVVVLAVLFVPAVILAWVFELTPEGLKRDDQVERSDSIMPQTGKKLDRIITIVLALALGYFAFDKFVLSEFREALIAESAREAGRTEALMDSYGDKSIAVLPFVNMSSDEEQEYFSDGISEELLILLARVPELRVISRSSAFSYKGKDIRLADVARELNVAHILEGSVRKDGNKVRITVKLIEARSDTQLWSETYDRSLDNIFAIQDEIASEVVTQLKVTLLGEMSAGQETSPQAYALFLQGRHLRHQRTAESYEQARALLRQSLAVDPNYAAAWVELGNIYTSQGLLGLRAADEAGTLAREAINKALEIDPKNALAHSILSIITIYYEDDLAAAARHLEHALRLEPSNADIIRHAASLTSALGRLDESIALAEFGVFRDPTNAVGHANLGFYYTSAGRWDQAIASHTTALTMSPGYASGHYKIGEVLLLRGEPQAALEAMQKEEEPIWRMNGLPMAYHALGEPDKSEVALAEFIEKYEQDAAYNIAFILAFRGEVDRAFEWLGNAVEYNDPGLSDILFDRLFTNIHDDPRWLPFLESQGKSPAQLDAIEFNITLPK